MNQPVQITFHNVQPSPAVTARIREAADKLDRYCNNIISCRVVAGAEHRHLRHGEPFQLRIHVRVPGATIAVQRTPGGRRVLAGGQAAKTTKQLESNSRHKDMYVAIHDAFDALRRRLEDYARRRRGAVKAHSRPAAKKD
jgi:ribosome-associated translation inhibitor RaiA